MMFKFSFSDRSKLMAGCWPSKAEENDDATKKGESDSISPMKESAKRAVRYIKSIFFNEDVDLRHPVPGSQLIANLTEEMEQYFTTGNSGPQQDSRRGKWINPTLLQPKTGKFVHPACCPFIGYAPLPLKELDRNGGHQNGIAFEYCRAELKKLLIAFKSRQEKVTLHFHPCDPLVFCYEDSPHSFDVIDSSSFLADNVGLVNLINAAARKLRSDQSVLFTESAMWRHVDPDVSHYVQNSLCCPLSLIPTIYGLRLIDIIDLGPDTFISTRNSPRWFSRLHWKRAQPFEGVSLVMSPLLEQCLERLKKLCFHVKSPSDSALSKNCGMSYYSPLTFCYVVCDLSRRGLSASTRDGIFQPPPLLRTAVDTFQGWMEGRLVWRVTVRFSFDADKKIAFEESSTEFDTAALRLILLPNSKVMAARAQPKEVLELLTDPDSQYIDNLEFKMKPNADGIAVDGAEISFLLADRNVLKTHRGIVVDHENRHVLDLKDGPIGIEHKWEVEKFTQPCPLSWGGESSNLASSGSKKLMAISCPESKDVYTIRFKFHPGGDKLSHSGIQNDDNFTL